LIVGKNFQPAGKSRRVFYFLTRRARIFTGLNSRQLAESALPVFGLPVDFAAEKTLFRWPFVVQFYFKK
jgi:hypothetical protein